MEIFGLKNIEGITDIFNIIFLNIKKYQKYNLAEFNPQPLIFYLVFVQILVF